jgi:hypothetical protein
MTDLPEDDDLSDAPALPGDRYSSNTPILPDTGYGPEIAEKLGETAEIILEQLTDTNDHWRFKTNEYSQNWFTEQTYEGRNGELRISSVDNTVEVFYSIEDDTVLPEELPELAGNLEQRMKSTNRELPHLFLSHRGLSMVFGEEIDEYEEEMDRYLKDFAYLTDFADRNARFYDQENDRLDEFF